MLQSMRRVARLFSSIKNPKFSRHEYKAVWNSVSKTENDAKFAVSGCTDEDDYKLTAQHAVEFLQNTVGVKPDDVILEIGAGVGRIGAALAPICKEWIGTDVSENMVSHIRHRLSAYPNVRAIATNGFDLSAIQSNSIDMVYCAVVFMHLDEWDRYNYVAEAFRVLKPGGRVLVDNINLASDEGWNLFESHRAIPPAQRPAQISKTSTYEELHIYLSRAGFVDIGRHEDRTTIRAYGRKPVPVGVSDQN